ncbi:LysE family translocator [Alteromonas sp. ASW11-130]|uniref:LysE family translocator n=1 Tax=Alteromonas sp. ASW11-130 TaxID=3015775 RepID=UPI002241E676|nr:LysE family translocator [Alteromonas sp. ASW11-130]MCW8092376.1 LysE family translocator [Alteromonas sp. ASW11-130]
MPWLDEFITIALVHLVAVASPGPDFAVVVRNSVAYGRKIAMWTSVGIGLGILLHVAYSLVGLSVVIKTTPWLYAAISYLAAAYLLYLAYGAIRSGPNNRQSVNQNELQQGKSDDAISLKKALWMGFLTNGLNPKATLFFLSLFTAIISVETPLSVKTFYGVYLAFATGAWFCFLSFLLSTNKVATLIGTKGYWLDRIMGVLLIGLAAKLVWT